VGTYKEWEKRGLSWPAMGRIITPFDGYAIPGGRLSVACLGGVRPVASRTILVAAKDWLKYDRLGDREVLQPRYGRIRSNKFMDILFDQHTPSTFRKHRPYLRDVGPMNAILSNLDQDVNLIILRAVGEDSNVSCRAMLLGWVHYFIAGALVRQGRGDILTQVVVDCPIEEVEGMADAISSSLPMGDYYNRLNVARAEQDSSSESDDSSQLSDVTSDGSSADDSGSASSEEDELSMPSLDNAVPEQPSVEIGSALDNGDLASWGYADDDVVVGPPLGTIAEAPGEEADEYEGGDQVRPRAKRQPIDFNAFAGVDLSKVGVTTEQPDDPLETVPEVPYGVDPVRDLEIIASQKYVPPGVTSLFGGTSANNNDIAYGSVRRVEKLTSLKSARGNKSAAPVEMLQHGKYQFTEETQDMVIVDLPRMKGVNCVA